VQGVKEKPWQLFGSLEAIYHPKTSDTEGFNTRSFKQSGFFQKLAAASGGVVLS
jgi:hypothetical protein